MCTSDKERLRAYRIFEALVKRIVALGGEVKIVEPDRSREHIQTVVFLGEERITSIRLREKSDSEAYFSIPLLSTRGIEIDLNSPCAKAKLLVFQTELELMLVLAVGAESLSNASDESCG